MAQMSTLVSEQFQLKTQPAIAMSLLGAVASPWSGVLVNEITRSILKAAVTHEEMRRSLE
jgi:hypothetical protein